MPEILKNYWVLEGLDGAGTTTQLKNLEKYLAKGHVNLLDEELAVRCIVRVADAVSGSSGHECFG